MRRALALSIVAFFARPAHAAIGVCDESVPSQATCTAQIEGAGAVVDDIFRDSQGRTGTQLPVFGKIVSAWPG